MWMLCCCCGFAAATLSFLYLTCTAPPRLLLSCLEALVQAHGTPGAATTTAAGDAAAGAAQDSKDQVADSPVEGLPKAAAAEAAAKLFLTPLLRYIRHKMVLFHILPLLRSQQHVQLLLLGPLLTSCPICLYLLVLVLQLHLQLQWLLKPSCHALLSGATVTTCAAVASAVAAIFCCRWKQHVCLLRRSWRR